MQEELEGTYEKLRFEDGNTKSGIGGRARVDY